MYIALEVLGHLVDLLAVCAALGLGEPQAMVAKLQQESMLVMGAIRRPIPGAPIAERIIPRYDHVFKSLIHDNCTTPRHIIQNCSR